MTGSRAFLYASSCVTGLQVRAHPSLKAVLLDWYEVRKATAGASGLIDFSEKPLRRRRAREVLRQHRGELILTEAARLLLPTELTGDAVRVGTLSGLLRRGTDLYKCREITASQLRASAGSAMEKRRLRRLVLDSLQNASSAVPAGIVDGPSAHAKESSDALRSDAAVARPRTAFRDHDAIDPLAILAALPAAMLERPLQSLALPSRAQHVFEAAKLTTLGDLAALGSQQIMELRHFGRTTAFAVAASLAEYIHDPFASHGLDEELPSNPLSDVAEPRDAAFTTLADALRHSIGSLPRRDSHALSAWLGVEMQPATLEVVGAGLGVTRERVRQIRNRAIKRITGRFQWPAKLSAMLDTLLEKRTEPLYLDLLAAENSWFDGFQDNLALLQRVIETFSNRPATVWILGGRAILASITAEDWQALKERAVKALEHEASSRLTSSQVKLLVESIAVGANARNLIGPLQRHCAELLHFQLEADGSEYLHSVGKGLRHAIADLLHRATRPLHLREVERELTTQGFTPRRKMALRNAIRLAGGVPFGSSLYGTFEHTGFDRSGADAAIRLLESIVSLGPPGKQWHCNELAQQLAQRLPRSAPKIDAYVVNVLLTRSGTLAYLGRLVWALNARRKLSTEDRFEVAMVVENVLERAGRPLTRAELRDAVRRVRGLNATFLPQPGGNVARLGRGQWGLIYRDFFVRGAEARRVLDKLEMVLQQKGSALHVSELSKALKLAGIRLPARAGLADEVLGLAQLDARFRVGRGSLIGLAEWREMGRLSLRQAVAQAISEISTTVTAKALERRVSELTARPIARGALSPYLAAAGYTFAEE